MESRMREIRTYGLTRGKSHRHAPQRLRPKVEIARASRRAYLRFGGYLAEGNPKGAQGVRNVEARVSTLQKENQ